MYVIKLLRRANAPGCGQGLVHSGTITLTNLRPLRILRQIAFKLCGRFLINICLSQLPAEPLDWAEIKCLKTMQIDHAN
jgi:hypothetical protein